MDMDIAEGGEMGEGPEAEIRPAITSPALTTIERFCAEAEPAAEYGW
jgi:hypothetical protein